MVSAIGYRNPGLLARMAASLDRICGGRMNFGFGAGGFDPSCSNEGSAATCPWPVDSPTLYLSWENFYK